MTHAHIDDAWTTQPAGAERRGYPRFPMVLAGRCSIGGGPDVACTTIDISLGGVALHAPDGSPPGASPDGSPPRPVGARVVLALPRLGIVEGHVARTMRDGFAVAFVRSRSQQQRLTRLLVAALVDGDAGGDRPAWEATAAPDAATAVARLFGA